MELKRRMTLGRRSNLKRSTRRMAGSVGRTASVHLARRLSARHVPTCSDLGSASGRCNARQATASTDRGAIRCPRATSGRRRSMLGSASKIEAASPPRVRFGRRACPTLSQARAAGGTAKVCVDWAFVSGVSPVSPYLELIDNYRNEDGNRHRQALVGVPARALGQVGQTQQSCAFKVGQQGRDTGETGGTARPSQPGEGAKVKTQVREK
jgi:hypothetical protein